MDRETGENDLWFQRQRRRAGTSADRDGKITTVFDQEE